VPQPTEIAQIMERRRLLVAESGRLRDRLAGDVTNLASTMEWAERGYSAIHSLRSVWPMVLVGAGFLFSQKRGGWLGSLGRIWSFWKIARKAFTIFREFTAR
jgi:hypothetical protein